MNQKNLERYPATSFFRRRGTSKMLRRSLTCQDYWRWNLREVTVLSTPLMPHTREATVPIRATQNVDRRAGNHALSALR